MHGKPTKKITPLPVKILVFLLVATLGVVGVSLLPATASEGWRPTLVLIGALGLITASLIEIVRAP
jgi:hypothetical protein